jgi:plasmid stabilization system protein ParE
MKIIWTDFAIENLRAIFDYYLENANEKVAHKIRKRILNSTNQLKTNPESGPIELNLESLKQGHRYVVIDNYKVIYRVFENNIIINDVFDTRQNPIKMNDPNR